MPAGKASQNRYKSLEKSFRLEQIKPYLPEDIYEKLKTHFGYGDSIYIWGANKGSISHLDKVQEEDYVLDVKNKEVPNVFQFCFYYKTPDTKLQNFIGWDEEKPREKQRPYRYVYFLKNPQTPSHDTKAYYGKALGHEDNPYWLMGQRYINDKQLNQALDKTNSKSVEEFLGLTTSQSPANNKQDRSTKVNSSEIAIPKEKQDTSSKPETSKIDHKKAAASQKLTEGQVIIKENETGISYEDLFSSYLKRASDITVVDPYIRLPYQVRNFMEFAQIIADNKSQKDAVLLHLITNNHDDYRTDSEDAFTEISNSLQPLGIIFTHEFDQNIHDRYIKTDTGWKIVLGRGLDIFQKPKGRYNIAELDQKQRKCKACEITYLRTDK